MEYIYRSRATDFAWARPYRVKDRREKVNVKDMREKVDVKGRMEKPRRLCTGETVDRNEYWCRLTQ